MNKKEALKELDKIYPQPCTNVGYNIKNSLEYEKYKILIEKFVWSEKDFDWLINTIKEKNKL